MTRLLYFLKTYWYRRQDEAWREGYIVGRIEGVKEGEKKRRMMRRRVEMN